MSWITDYFTEDVTLTAPGTVQADGTYPYSGSAVSARARVKDETKRIYSPDGAEIVYDRAFWLSPDVTIAQNYRITWNSTNHEVVEIRKHWDVNGVVTHYKVFVRISGV